MNKLGFIFIVIFYTVHGLKLQPIENGKSHTIQNQDDGSYLFAVGGTEGKVTTGEFNGNTRQKWIFHPVVENGESDIYTINTEANESNYINQMGQKWELIKVGHGKRWIKNSQTQLCLQSAGRGRSVTEGECSRNFGKQRWYIEAIKTRS